MPAVYVADAERRSREKTATPSVEEPLPPAPMSTAGLLALQRSAGNAAVQRAILARNGDGATAAPAAPGAKTPDQAFADALAARDYDKLAVLLNSVYTWQDAGDTIDTLDEDHLRPLDDGVRRVLPASAATRLLIFIRSRLGDLGVEEERQEPGARYGEMEVVIGTVKDGVKTGPGRQNYEYPVRISFLPDEDACDADSISFIQRVRLVDTATGRNKDPDVENQRRATGRQSSIDRIPGKAQGWYGMEDDLSDQTNLKTWTRGGGRPTASMTDTPSGPLPNTTWEFETAVVSRTGPDAGTVYAVVTWGFTVDENLKVTGMPNLMFNKPTSDFSAAVAGWNKQAAGPRAKRSAPAQKPLPALQ